LEYRERGRTPASFRPPFPKSEEAHMTSNTPERNKALALEAFDTLFNKRDYEAASRFWADKYIQHSAHIEPGREGLFRLIPSLPDSLRFEHGLILAESDYVIVHGRFSGTGRPAVDRTHAAPLFQAAVRLYCPIQQIAHS
jgi:hypothetical protein